APTRSAARGALDPRGESAGGRWHGWAEPGTRPETPLRAPAHGASSGPRSVLRSTRRWRGLPEIKSSSDLARGSGNDAEDAAQDPDGIFVGANGDERTPARQEAFGPIAGDAFEGLEVSGACT